MQHPEGCGRQLPRREGLSCDLLRWAVMLAFRRRAVSDAVGGRPVFDVLGPPPSKWRNERGRPR